MIRATEARVMFLHGVRGGPSSEKVNKIRGEVKELSVPNLKTKYKFVMFIVIQLLWTALNIAGLVLSIIYLDPLLASLLWLVVITMMFSVSGLFLKYMTIAATIRGVAIADEEFERFQPDLIIATGSGCVIACKMSKRHVPCLLLSPLNEYYADVTGQSLPGLFNIPYTIVVHAVRDDKSRLSSSLRLIETCETGDLGSRLEIVYDDRQLSSITGPEYSLLILEMMNHGSGNFSFEAGLSARSGSMLVSKVPSLTEDRGETPPYDPEDITDFTLDP